MILENRMDKELVSKQAILDFLKKKKSDFQKDFGVLEIGLFGSFAKDNPIEESDIDIAVKLITPSYDSYIGLKDFLESHLHRKVDLYRLRDKESSFQKRIKRTMIYV